MMHRRFGFLFRRRKPVHRDLLKVPQPAVGRVGDMNPSELVKPVLFLFYHAGVCEVSTEKR